MENIVQVEFFHVGGGGPNDSLEHLNQFIFKCLERVSEGSRIKTVVRFYDDNAGHITKAVENYYSLDQAHIMLVQDICRSKGIKRWLFSIVDKQVLRARDRAKSLCLRRIVDRLHILSRQMDLAVEKNDHSFRRVRPDEVHELLEAVRCAVNYWAFIFEPNELLADNNKMITHAM